MLPPQFNYRMHAFFFLLFFFNFRLGFFVLSLNFFFLSVLLSPLLRSVCRERTVSQGPRGRWEQRGTQETMELQVAEEKMGLRGPKDRWVLRENLALLVLLERRYKVSMYNANHN